MAKEIAKAVEKKELTVILKKADDCVFNDLIEVDGLAIGSPTYYGNMAWPVKRFLDETILSFLGADCNYFGVFEYWEKGIVMKNLAVVAGQGMLKVDRTPSKQHIV